MSGWVPVYCLMGQVIVWGMILPRIVSSRTIALLTFTPDPKDPDW